MDLHGQNAAVVDSIIDRKIQSGEYKEHPDCPDEEAATLYYVLVNLGHLQEDEVEERIGVSANVAIELGTEAGHWIQIPYHAWTISHP